jgi:hypothetical protein
MSNSFEDRIEVANALVNALNRYYWERLPQQYGVLHVAYGYETHVPRHVQDRLKRIYTTTARHIRFTPDYFIVAGNTVLLFEYKVMKTPRYSERERQWNIGQMEADAWENYMNLLRADIDIAILIYCPYHPRPLLCGCPDENWLVRARTHVQATRGSGTPYVNVDLSCIDEFDVFSTETLGIPLNLTRHLLDHSFFNELMNNPLLQTSHHPRSPYVNNADYATGFNWEGRYKP